MIIKSFTTKLFFLIFYFYSNITYSANNSSHSLAESLQHHPTNPEITAAIPNNFPPFYYTDSEGMPYGLGIEVLNEIDHHAGYLTSFIIKNNWADVFKAVESGEAQLIPNLGITDERKKHYFFSNTYAKTDITVLTRANHSINSEATLAN